MSKCARPKFLTRNAKDICRVCGKKDFPIKSGKCRFCDPNGFYVEYPADVKKGEKK